MTESIQKLKHILYRIKMKVLHQSAFAMKARSAIWREPSADMVSVVYHTPQDINHHFEWTDIENVEARAKLKEFTQRYALEPDIVYEFKGDLIIEPSFGLVIGKGRRFIPESGTLSHTFLKPALIPYLRQRYINRKYTNYSHLFHIDGFAGKNLCHFIYDTINPVVFLFNRGLITKESPLLVSAKVFERPYFQYYLKHSFIGELNWVIQGQKEWIKAERVTRAFVSMEVFPLTKKLITLNTRPHRKIFLNRKNFFQRNIRNIGRVKEILDRHEFESIFAEDLTYEQQVELFSTVRYFVGIHGAGLTNLIHSDIHRLRVMEIFPASYVIGSFYRFLKILGVEYYDAFLGTKADINQSFAVDEIEFEKRLLRLLASDI